MNLPETPLPGIKLFDLSGRVALITGGSKGLGYAIAAALASAGASIAVFSRGKEGVEDACASLDRDFSVSTLAVCGDVACSADVDRAVAATLARFGRIDILVNSAGINIRGSITELSLDQFRAVQHTNVEGMWLMSRGVVGAMRQTGWGRIINMASTLGMVGLANRTPYASSKGAVVQMTRALALELAPDNIVVNAICPGPFLTPMNEPIANSEEAQRMIVGAVALNRWGRLEEIQGAAIYLASPAASYTTGSLLVVDGGWTAR